MRKLLIGLVILVALAVGADWFVKQEAEQRVAKQVADAYELNQEPEISIEGFPFIVNAVRGHLPGVEIRAARLQKEGVKLEDFHAHLEDIRFETSVVLSGKADVSAGQGGGSVVLPLDSVQVILDRRGGFGGPPRIHGIQGSGLLISHETWGDVVVTPELDGSNIILSSNDLQQGPITLTLPAIASGVRYRDVKVDSKGLVLDFVLEESALRLAD